MWLIVVYVLLVVVGEAFATGVGLVLDRIAPAASLPVGLSIFFAVLWAAWVLAVRLTEPKQA